MGFGLGGAVTTNAELCAGFQEGRFQAVTVELLPQEVSLGDNTLKGSNIVYLCVRVPAENLVVTFSVEDESEVSQMKVVEAAMRSLEKQHSQAKSTWTSLKESRRQ